MRAGVDVIFSAAGPSGLGVINAAKDSDALAIGVDSNQNHVQPGFVLTSMLKRVDPLRYCRRWSRRRQARGRQDIW